MVPDHTTAGCLVTDTETCAVCGEEEEQGEEHKIVKNYKQGGHVRIVIEFSKSGYTSTNQVRLCQRNGQQKLIVTPIQPPSRPDGAGDRGVPGEHHLDHQPGPGAGQCNHEQR